jgi:hypothetical protein
MHLAGVTEIAELLVCSNRGRPVPETDAEELRWRFYSDGVGALHPFCPLCIRREFSADAPASRDLTPTSAPKRA